MWYEFSEDKKRIIIKHPRTIGYRWIRNETVPNIVKEYEKYLTFVKEDKNGTLHYKGDICPSCIGEGKVYLGISDNNEYICNKCEGRGKLKRSKTYKIHTHEYGKVLEEEYMDKQNDKLYESHGINKSDNTTYVYLGNTYAVKEQLKERGAKYDDRLGWHSKELIDGYDYIKVVVPIRKYKDNSIGYDYGYEGGNPHRDRENYNMDDLRVLIRKANKNVECNKE